MKNFLASFLLFILFNGSVFSSESIGFYSKGSLRNAQSVFERGTPIHKLFVARGRLYTSDDMHSLLTTASEFITAQFPDSETLQVGDLSNRNGGLAQGHDSHQNGLDGDIVYLRRDHHVQSPAAPDWDEDFVGTTKPTANFNTERNFALFKELVKTTPVARIFVDVAIKKQLCEYAKSSGELKDPQSIETLRRLRPQDLHRTHFHVRISCPVADRECTPQSAPAKGDGCDDLSILLEEAVTIEAC